MHTITGIAERFGAKRTSVNNRIKALIKNRPELAPTLSGGNKKQEWNDNQLGIITEHFLLHPIVPGKVGRPRKEK